MSGPAERAPGEAAAEVAAEAAEGAEAIEGDASVAEGPVE